MITSKVSKFHILIILLLIAIGIFFRFYNFSWGKPYFFHPDERNIANSISQLSYKESLNPKFFAYGSLPIYSVYAAGVILNGIDGFMFAKDFDYSKVGFENSIIIGRLFSAILSIVLLFVIYKAGDLLANRKVGILSVILASFSIGYLQYSHFTTFEIWLSLLTILLCFFSIKFIKTHDYKYYFFSAIVLGGLMSVKISSASLLPLVITILSAYEFGKLLKSRKNRLNKIGLIILRLTLLLSIVVITINITSPFFWLDNQSFRSSIEYESSVAIGTLKVFYSMLFENTSPLLYQLTKVYPFILNPVIAVISIISTFFIFYLLLFKKRVILLVPILFLAATFFSQSFLYVKWIRYYIPTLAFIYLFVSIFLVSLMNNRNRKIEITGKVLTILLIIISIIYALSYFKTVLLDTDSRVSAAEWASKNISGDAMILSEVYDMGIVPFNQYFNNIELFNFYELENDPAILSELSSRVEGAEYIIIPSQRLIESRLNNPLTFPKGYLFYRSLTDKNQFSRIYKTPCDIFCLILYNGNPAGSYEQTANVFDRPQVQIFKKLNEN